MKSMDYTQQMHRYIEQLSVRVATLESTVQKLEQQIKELEEKTPINIEKIEYKFEQLKIDSLDGTLNIGLNPLTPDNLEDIIINNQTPEITLPQQGPQNPSLKPLDRNITKQWVEDIYASMTSELDQHGYSMVQHVLDQRSMTIEGAYYDFIIEDVKKQLEQRITYYLNQVQSEELEQNFEAIKPQIIEKIYEDIKKGIDAFLTYLPDSLKKGGHNQ
ncbi:MULTISPECIES: spore germination protein GerPC [Bacillaceae]|uniref:spore germination protein GerPC n=1 Tax=Bacillaceae TaxID=186817 RepID=UPI0022060EBF|nr:MULTISPECIES: spore germination protein GerPC [Bacillaceae]MDT2048149.1 spore germination protein GerPC [Priestia flexa]USY55764.1 spore germination protein GerPC [Bacillus sp. 1780r2a1]